MNIEWQDWMDIIRKEYLQDFIKRGGAAVKFIVSDKETSQEFLHKKLPEMAEEESYFFGLVDAVSTKIHMVDEIFHKIARQVDWDNLAYRFITRIFEDKGFNLPERLDDFNLQQIALINKRQEKFLREDVKSWLEEEIYCDFKMSQEFRIAMIHLCLSRVDNSGINPSLSTCVKEWLRGELRLISALKKGLIFQKIARHNARHMLFSLAHWLKINEFSGFILALEISRYMVATRSGNPDDGFFYSTPAVLDAYEVLREFIDGTDEMEGFLVVVFSTKDFLADDRRGLNRYEALKLRILDEVRPRHRQNPLASLTRLP